MRLHWSFIMRPHSPFTVILVAVILGGVALIAIASSKAPTAAVPSTQNPAEYRDNLRSPAGVQSVRKDDPIAEYFGIEGDTEDDKKADDKDGITPKEITSTVTGVGGMLEFSLFQELARIRPNSAEIEGLLDELKHFLLTELMMLCPEDETLNNDEEEQWIDVKLSDIAMPRPPVGVHFALQFYVQVTVKGIASCWATTQELASAMETLDFDNDFKTHYLWEVPGTASQGYWFFPNTKTVAYQTTGKFKKSIFGNPDIQASYNARKQNFSD